ncbi:MAG: universal stress protein [Candidatus Methanoperedens sp.]|nr:universal stress protein [Candidatus Methanoperedens sp.]
MAKFQFLLPLDESVHTEIAADNAIKMARMYNADVSTVHVVDTGVFEDPEDIKTQTEFGQTLLDKYGQYCGDKGVEIVKASVLVGSPFNEIIKMQKDIDASLIILGAPDSKLGSTAERVVRGARCHVLIAREKTAGDEPYKHILVPVDGSEDSDYAARFAASIAHRSASNLTACHVIQNLKKLPEGKAITKKVIELAESKGIKAASIVREGEISEEILKAIDSEPFDLTVIGYTGRGRISRLILGSVSEKVIRSSSCSVFVVKSLRTERIYTVQKSDR